MLGLLRFSQQLLDHLAPDMVRLVQGFIGRGTLTSMTVDQTKGEVYYNLDHPDFTEADSATTYMLYMGNRLNRATGNMEPRILHLDKIGDKGRLIPVRYYEGNTV